MGNTHPSSAGRYAGSALVVRAGVPGWRDWCLRWRDPAVLLAAAGAIGAAVIGGTGVVVGQSQLVGRVESLEKRADQQAATLSRAQELVGLRVENLDAKVNQFSLQMATLSPRLDGVYELLKAVRDSETETDRRIIESNHARDEAARLRDVEWSRRFDTLTALMRPPDRR